MPQRVVRQPNGLLAVFSTIVDSFTMYDHTEAEMCEEWQLKIGREEGVAKVARGLADDMTGIGEVTANDGLNRWRDALETIGLIHGDKERAKWEAIGQTQPSAS